MRPNPYIAFEGPIAAGKTTMSMLLAAHLGADLVLEEFDKNEFLEDFYWSRERWSLHMQLSFLSARFPILRSVSRPQDRGVVADYTARKDPLFARLLLNGRELRLFNHIASLLATKMETPDLIVFLDARNDNLLDRIKRRGRRYEETIDSEYLDELRTAYDEDLKAAGLTVLRYDTSALDLESADQVREFLDLVVASVPGADASLDSTDGLL